MEVCQTCGKTLNNNEVFTVKGFVQCEECAYTFSPENMYENDSDTKKPVSQAFKVNNSWCRVLKLLGKLNIIFGCIMSIVIGIIIFCTVYDGEIIGLCVIVAGIVFSILSSSLLMAFTEMADNIAAIRYNSDKKQ